MVSWRTLVALGSVSVAGCQLILGIDPNVAILDGGLDATPASDAPADVPPDAPVDAADAATDTSVDALPDAPPCNPATLDHDTYNCGACGHDCLGGACTSGVCQPVVLATASSGTLTTIASDATFVFWATDDGHVGRVGKDGSNPHNIIAASNGIVGLAIDATRVYYSSFAGGWVLAAAKDGSNPGQQIALGQSNVGPLAVNGVAAFWSTWNSSDSGIMRRVLDGGAPALVWGGRTTAPCPCPISSVATDDIDVYWVQDYTSTILQGRGDGTGATMELAGECYNVELLALDDAGVYFTGSNGPSLAVMRVNKGDSRGSSCFAPSMTTLAVDDAGTYGIAVAGGYSTWTTHTTPGAVRVVPTTPPFTARTLASAQALPGAITSDDHAAYWVNEGDGTVMKVAF